MRVALFLLLVLSSFGIKAANYVGTFNWAGANHPVNFRAIDCATVREEVTKVMVVQLQVSDGAVFVLTCVTGFPITSVPASLTLKALRVASGSVVESQFGVTIDSVVEDDVISDIEAISLQRVLVLVGCAMLFGLGWVAGK